MQSKLAVIIVHTLSGLPLVIWFMRGFFVEIPNTIEEAAMVHGIDPDALVSEINDFLAQA